MFQVKFDYEIFLSFFVWINALDVDNRYSNKGGLAQLL